MSIVIRGYYFLLIALSAVMYGCSEEDHPSAPPENYVFDIDSNRYPTVKICDQVWIAENLRVTRFRNGDEIPYKKLFNWNFIPPGNIHYGFISDSDSLAMIYGYLYNWITANDSRGLAPSGWHIPSSLEWQELLNCLGGEDEAGKKLRETGSEHWEAPNTGATNESGFTALPGSTRLDNWLFTEADAIGEWTEFWTSSACTDTVNYFGPLENYGESIAVELFNNRVPTYCSKRTEGLYVRCIKDK